MTILVAALYDKSPHMVGGHKDCGRGDIMILVIHVIPEDHVTKG